ncbi:MAG TPA: hypothetical protein ENJ09_12600 [Planctomycetes bacterium]|nr:hypothetical protein [Planctomycetota bacterium]
MKQGQHIGGWVLRALAPCLLAVLAAAAPQERESEGEWTSLALRVLEVSAPGELEVDRGELDGLAVGDPVLLFPRSGGTLRGTVINVDTRSARIRLEDEGAAIAAGVRGEARVPPERFRREEQTEPLHPNADPPVLPPPSEPRWENRDESWRKGMPLLHRARAVRPERRAPRVSGRGYLIFDRTWTSEDSRNDSQLRAGTNLRIENPFRRGGTLRFDAEYDARSTVVPDAANEDDSTLRFERLSYAIGGTRFQPSRIEAGRFLQRGLPEFGVVDGVQWETRRANADRWGVSLGYLPELDARFRPADDLSVAAWYRWNADPSERFSVTAGLQKTWHGGSPDRDLVVTKVRYVPVNGWSFHGSTWVDFYGSKDRNKASGPEITQAIYSLSRQGNDGGIEFRFRRLRFAELLRNELLPVEPGQLARDRYDRVSARGWTRARKDRRLHGEVGLWDDEDEAGGDLEAGIEFPGLFTPRSRTDLTAFATSGRFTTSGGGRVTYSVEDEEGRYDLFYEWSVHRADGFSSAVDDFVQHRLRGSRSIYSLSGFDVYFDVDALLYDDEAALSIGLRLEQSY